VHGTRRTSSPVDGAADRGANAGRDGRACRKREEGPGSDRWMGQLTTPLSSQATGRKGEKKLGGGGLDVGVPRGAGVVWGLAPTGGRRPDHVPAVSGRGSEKREARCAWAGPGRKRVGRVQMNSIVLDLFKLIQMSSK
jgi:hypothetical protein